MQQYFIVFFCSTTPPDGGEGDGIIGRFGIFRRFRGFRGIGIFGEFGGFRRVGAGEIRGCWGRRRGGGLGRGADGRRRRSWRRGIWIFLRAG